LVGEKGKGPDGRECRTGFASGGRGLSLKDATTSIKRKRRGEEMSGAKKGTCSLQTSEKDTETVTETACQRKGIRFGGGVGEKKGARLVDSKRRGGRKSKKYGQESEQITET